MNESEKENFDDFFETVINADRLIANFGNKSKRYSTAKIATTNKISSVKKFNLLSLFAVQKEKPSTTIH